MAGGALLFRVCLGGRARQAGAGLPCRGPQAECQQRVDRAVDSDTRSCSLGASQPLGSVWALFPAAPSRALEAAPPALPTPGPGRRGDVCRGWRRFASALLSAALTRRLGVWLKQTRVTFWPRGSSVQARRGAVRGSCKPSYVSASPATGAVQAEPRPDRGRGEEAVHVAAPERQGGARPLPLQRPRGAPAHSQRGDLGLQQGERSLRSPAGGGHEPKAPGILRSPAGGTNPGAGVSPARGPALPQGSGQPQGAPAGSGHIW